MSMRMICVGAACFAAATALLAADARAQAIYFGAEGGWSMLEDQTNGVTGLSTGHARFDSGFAAGARVGYEMGPWRFEEEYAYRRNGLSHLDLGGVTAAGVSGSRQSHAVMTNVIYDVNLAGLGWNLPWAITPHIGAGVGAVDVIDQAKATGLGQLFNDDEWSFGYQAIGGIRYNMTPNVAFDLDYRYLATPDVKLKIPGTGATYKTGYATHNLMASLVYRFGPPPPPPPVAAPPIAPAPPVAERRVFMVFFDWDRATITPQGMSVVRQAADAFRAGAPVQIQVTGYTDRSGSPGYNQRLSERRAHAVAGALERLGVARNQMAVSGRGENDNRVPTADGVREPQNRRVEIVFS